MKLIQTVDTEGTVLCHDITRIIKGVTKDVVFHKGHMVTKEDIPALLNVRKGQLYVQEKEDGILHENDAAEILCDMCKEQHMERSQAKEGEIELTAACDGLLKVDNRGLKAANGFEQMMIATRHGNFAVEKKDKLAGIRIIPPVTEEEKMEAAEETAAKATGGCPILELKPFLHERVGIVTTRNEVLYGRIKGTFAPVIRGKLSKFDTEVINHVTWNDGDTRVTASILDIIQKDTDIAVCKRGMSVDPDNKTSLTIHNAGADIVSCDAPALPGAMFLLACYQVKDRENPRTVAIMGLPGCVVYARRTVFDLALPRIMTNGQVTADGLAALGQGGLCLNCPECTFPSCGFGKGM